mmetsp:Transcript_51646/g.129709  ORF Transcript_51646/g.129709 Transcript_51646/m.129709 type:complete len:250 (+) Transcript_51646:679-1428(+)
MAVGLVLCVCRCGVGWTVGRAAGAAMVKGGRGVERWTGVVGVGVIVQEWGQQDGALLLVLVLLMVLLEVLLDVGCGRSCTGVVLVELLEGMVLVGARHATERQPGTLAGLSAGPSSAMCRCFIRCGAAAPVTAPAASPPLDLSRVASLHGETHPVDTNTPSPHGCSDGSSVVWGRCGPFGAARHETEHLLQPEQPVAPALVLLRLVLLRVGHGSVVLVGAWWVGVVGAELHFLLKHDGLLKRRHGRVGP